MIFASKYVIIVQMNMSHEHTPKNPDRDQSPVLPAFLGRDLIVTGDRFSLATTRLGSRSLDIMTQQLDHEDFGRFLIVNNDDIEEAIWDGLVEKDIPRLPLYNRDDEVWVFGVRDGLKPLASEAIFDHPSSETYVGDDEIYFELGRLYRNVYEATGVLLLEGDVEEASPVDHVAISNFSDGHGHLTLYPPYRVSDQYRNLELSQASELFKQSLKSRFDKLVSYQESLRDVSQQLVEKASQGFGGL